MCVCVCLFVCLVVLDQATIAMHQYSIDFVLWSVWSWFKTERALRWIVTNWIRILQRLVNPGLDTGFAKRGGGGECQNWGKFADIAPKYVEFAWLSCQKGGGSGQINPYPDPPPQPLLCYMNQEVLWKEHIRRVRFCLSVCCWFILLNSASPPPPPSPKGPLV